MCWNMLQYAGDCIYFRFYAFCIKDILFWIFEVVAVIMQSTTYLQLRFKPGSQRLTLNIHVIKSRDRVIVWNTFSSLRRKGVSKCSDWLSGHAKHCLSEGEKLVAVDAEPLRIHQETLTSKAGNKWGLSGGGGAGERRAGRKEMALFRCKLWVFVFVYLFGCCYVILFVLLPRHTCLARCQEQGVTCRARVTTVPPEKEDGSLWAS